MKAKLRKYLDRIPPIYVNGVDLRLCLDAKEEIQRARAAGELTEEDETFLRYMKAIIRILLWTALMVVLLLILIPIASHMESDLSIVCLIVAGMGVSLLVPNRVLHKALNGNHPESQGSLVLRWVLMAGYWFSWATLVVFAVVAVGGGMMWVMYG